MSSGLRRAAPLLQLFQPFLQQNRSALRATATYLVLSPLSSLLSSLLGSFSEYRFPHPLLTTTLHALLSLSLLTSLSLLLPRLPRNRLLSRAPPQHQRLSLVSLTPSTLSAALSATLAALSESHAHRVVEPDFWTLVRLAPVPLSWAFERGTRGDEWRGEGGGALVVVLVLGLGPAVGWRAGSEGWMCAVGWALGVVGWVTGVQSGLRDTEDKSARPSLRLHLLLSTILLLPPLLLSHEIGTAWGSGHFGFFTSPGFLAQELVFSLCGLANLWAFWGMLDNLSSTNVFLVVALKDALLPHVFATFLGNYLPRGGTAVLSGSQQAFALVLVGGYWVAEAVGRTRGGARDKVG